MLDEDSNNSVPPEGRGNHVQLFGLDPEVLP